jgi:hypothetical protein
MVVHDGCTRRSTGSSTVYYGLEPGVGQRASGRRSSGIRRHGGRGHSRGRVRTRDPMENEKGIVKEGRGGGRSAHIWAQQQARPACACRKDGGGRSALSLSCTRDQDRCQLSAQSGDD